MWGRWRARSVENVGEEIKLLYDKYRVSQIFFKDDEFTVSQERVEGICDFIVENKLDIIWECLGRVNDVNDKILEKMYRAGCRALTFGIEVGYEEGLKKIRKGFTLNQAKRAIDLTKNHGMISVASFILGFPWEGIDEIKKTIRFARFLNADITEFNMLVPYFGTEIYEIVTEKRLFVKDYAQKLINYSMHEVNPVIRTEHLTAEQLRYWRGKAYLEIFFNPLSLLRSFKSSISFGSVKRKVLGGVELLTVSLRDMLGL
jgi:magnesium-protoporphyrin IX monomethyl ester (oxidative) cyclase